MPEERTPPPPGSMAPVPAGHYNTRDELMDFVKTWARDQGYAIVIARSRSNRLWLKCDRGGKYENRRNITEDQRKRKRGDSRLMGCPFLVIAILKDNVWKVKTEKDKHNHEPSEDLTVHPSLRKMTPEQMNVLQQMTDAGSTPAEIMETLKVRFPTINIVKRDVYNARKKYKEHKRNGGAPTSPAADSSWEDPNGVVPGPTPTGKWVWAEAGDELVNKGKKKRKKIFVPNPSPTLDPDLETSAQTPSANQPFSADNLASAITFPDFSPSFQDTTSSSLNLQPTDSTHQPGLDRHNSAPNPLQQLSDFSTGNFSTTSMDDNSFFTQPQPPQQQRNSFPNISVPSLQQQDFSPARADPAVMTSPPTQQSSTSTPSTTMQMTTRSASSSAAAQSLPLTDPSTSSTSPERNPNGQVLMSRIERMEKEQRDQKSMLTKILGAVTGQMADV